MSHFLPGDSKRFAPLSILPKKDRTNKMHPWKTFVSTWCTVCAFAVSSSGIIAEEPALKFSTPIDKYIAQDDGVYDWDVDSSFAFGPLKTTVIKLTSQKWLTEKEVDYPLWQHWLVVTVPENVKTDRVFLFIGGGSRDSKAPTSPDPITSTIAATAGCIVAELKSIPNQPLIFHNDGVPRKEDDLIGYGWSQFLETGDPMWLPRLPMVKSVVKAMDCITEFAASEAGGGRKIGKFVVGGGSKRGWTTWMSGVADPRIEAIVPIVIDVVNAESSLRHHAEAYGFWSEAIGNYYQHKILQRYDHPRMQALYENVDPYYFRDRLSMPKYVVNGSGDQFFLPDSSRFYFEQLQGPKIIRYVPNADHGLKGSDAVQSIAAFFHAITTEQRLPIYDWSFAQDGILRVTSESQPTSVMLWQASNPNARDFRLKTIGPAFESTLLKANADGSYTAKIQTPEKGWTASYMELEYDLGGPFPLKVSTAVYVTPDLLPFKGVDLTKVRYEAEVSKD